MGKAICLCFTLAFLLCLCACQAPQQSPSEEESPAPSITAEEGVQVLEDLLGETDAATGNPMSYGYEGTLVLDGVTYYNYRVSWLVNGDHMSYLTNYLVSSDGLIVQEYLPEDEPA